MLRPEERKELQGVVYRGVEEDMDYSKDSFKVDIEGDRYRLEHFMKHRRKLSKYEDENISPLHHAAAEGQVELMKMIIHGSSCEDFLDTYQRTSESPEECLGMSGHERIEVGEEHGYKREFHINFVNHKKASPLHLAVQSGDLDMIKMCLDNGAHIDMIEASVQSMWLSDLRISIHYFPNALWLLYTQNTALHFAAREGHAKAVAMLLSYNADILLNKQHASFLHIALHNKRKEVVLTTIRSKRWDECLQVFSHYSPSNRCPITEMVEYLPECMKIEYNFKYLQCPLSLTKKVTPTQDVVYEPLTILNDAFSSPLLSLIQTFTMMLGDINYRDAFLEPLLKKELAYPILTFGQLILFTMFVPIVLMNLLIGLAVGDIAEVQKHASLKRIAMQRFFHYFLWTQETRQEVPNTDMCLEMEILKQKYRLKDLTSLLEKQHELIKLIIQKMEIISETEDEDNHCSFQDKFKKERLEQMQSKWNFVLNAVKTKTH
ncbi:transient receptor potential cation channel subfamily A member 1 [Cricetulus griseus]